MQQEFGETLELEVFDAAQFPQYDVVQIAANFETVPRETGEDVQPPLVVGHSEDQAILADSGLPAAGWVSSLRAVGTKLVATVRDVPKIVAEAIARRAYRRVSAELYTDYKGLGQTLRRVALLGGAIPKVKTLQDVIALYSDDEPFETVTVEPAFAEASEGESAELGVRSEECGTPSGECDEEAQQPEVTQEAQPAFAEEPGTDENAELAMQSGECEEQMEQTDVTQEVQPDSGEPDSDADEAQPGDDLSGDAARRGKIGRFCEQLKAEGHYAPAWDELGMGQFLLNLDADRAVCFSEGGAEQTLLDWFVGFLRSQPRLVNFSEKAPACVDPRPSGRKPLADFYRRHRSEFERLGVSLEMFLESEVR